MHEQLLKIRGEIDKIDQQILMLLAKRADLCIDALSHKRETSIPIYAPEREQYKIQKACTENTSKLSNESIAKIFQSIIEECRELQIQIVEE